MARRLALVTGGTSGIGLGVARALAGDGLDLALGYAADDERAAAAERELAAAFPEARVRLFRRHLGSGEDGAALVEEVEAAGGAPAVLVHCAGRIRDGLFAASPLADHAERVAEHLLVAMGLAHRALDAMLRRRFGRIVFVSSIAARRPRRGQAGYAAAKAGLEGLTRALAIETAHRGVTVNAVAPGIIETPMTEPLLAGLLTGGEKRLRAQIPVGRVGRPEDVAALVRFLCGEAGGYVTGTVLTVDGGRLLAEVGGDE